MRNFQLRNSKTKQTDNTNADVETRSHWIALGKRFNIPVRCVYFKTNPGLCAHNDAVRAFSGTTVRLWPFPPDIRIKTECEANCNANSMHKMNPEKRTMLPRTAFTAFASRLQEPNPKEGFDEIVMIDFQVRTILAI